jgi:hypothetical protein
MQSRHLSLISSHHTVSRLGRGCGGVLFAALLFWGGCDDKSPQRRSGTASVRTAGKGGSQVQQAPGGGYVESSENAAERGEAIRRVCTRKMSSELPTCWSAEVERTKNRKLEVNIGVMLTISPAGKAEKVEVLSPKPDQQSLEQCVVDAVRNWSFPEGTETASMQCHFFLRSSQ